MSFLGDKIKTVQVTAKHLAVELADGRGLRLPLTLFPALAEAAPKARSRWELCAAGTGIHWPLLNYDLSAAGLLRGEPEAPGIRRARKSGKYPEPKPPEAMALAETPLTAVEQASSLSPKSEPVGTRSTASHTSPAPQMIGDDVEVVPTKRQKPSALVDTRVIYCGDNLEQLRKLPDACVDRIYIDPPLNSNRNYEVFWGETKEKRAFETAMRRSKREKGFFIAFDYTEDALREIDRFFKADHAVIIPLTVQEILDEQIARKLV
jgi:hypothetical protein